MVHFTDVGPMTSRDVFSHYCNFTFAKFGNFGIFLKTAVLCRLVQTWYIWLDKSRTNKLDLVLVVMSCMLCHLTYVILLNQFDAIKHISDFEPIFWPALRFNWHFFLSYRLTKPQFSNIVNDVYDKRWLGFWGQFNMNVNLAYRYTKLCFGKS